jgi:hypothetical protein
LLNRECQRENVHNQRQAPRRACSKATVAKIHKRVLMLKLRWTEIIWCFQTQIQVRINEKVSLLEEVENVANGRFRIFFLDVLDSVSTSPVFCQRIVSANAQFS